MRNSEIEIDKDYPFKNCLLKREGYGIALSKLVKGIENGGVIALNNSWGGGKTTFVKMWKQMLENSEYSTIYFNAWEHDFDESPLAPLVAELKASLPSTQKFDSLLKLSGKLLVDISSVVVTKLIEKHLVGEKTLSEIVRVVNDHSKELMTEEIKQYIARKENIDEFKNELVQILSDTTKKLPLVFFIDELDRCRPNYAVKLLETIKHVFTVPNILYVLSIDKEQLGYAIQGAYGSDKIDSEEYLRRFIDIEYSLPVPDIASYVSFLLTSTGVHDILASNGKNVLVVLRDYVSLFFGKDSLRKIEKIVHHLSITIKNPQFRTDSIYFLLFLIFLKYHEIDFYKELRSKTIRLDQIGEKMVEVYNSLPTNSFPVAERNFVSLEADLLYLYGSFISEGSSRRQETYSVDSNVVIPKFTSKINNERFAECFIALVKGYDAEPQKLSELFNIIELQSI